MLLADIPVFVLCRRSGTRLKEMTEFRPKPMIPIGQEPILVHIQRPSWFGFSRFVLCLSYKIEVIREYFLNFYSVHSDAPVDLKTNAIEVHTVDYSSDRRVTLAYTGETAMTGSRKKDSRRKRPGITMVPNAKRSQFNLIATIDHKNIGAKRCTGAFTTKNVARILRGALVAGCYRRC
jgi:hypothetical protein